MNCIVPGANLKLMSKAILALSKIGDELFFEAKPDRLCFVSMNSSKTAFTGYNFLEAFFSTYTIEQSGENEPVTCKIPMKSMLSIFKKSPMHKDKKIDFCKVELEMDSTKIIFKFKYKNDVMIVHSLNLIDYESVSVSYNKDSIKSMVSGSGQFFNQFLSNFQTSDEDMSLEFSSNKVVVRNYDTNITNMQKGIRSQVTLMAPEFLQYRVVQDTAITLSLKPFRSAIHFAEFFSLNLGMYFQTGGRPCIVEIKNPTFEANYVMATVNSEGSTQSSVSTVTSAPKHQGNNKRPDDNITVQDQEAIEGINWDDFDMPEPNEKKSTGGSSKSRASFNDIVNRELKAREKEKSVLNRTTKGTCDNRQINDSFRNHLDLGLGLNCVPQEENEIDVIPASPESPRSKRARIVFGKCNEATFHTTNLDLGKELAADSDFGSDSDN